MAEENWQPTKAEYWKNLPAPARPWPSEVAWFERYVLEKKAEGKKDVLILGSTVEFRAMCHKNEVNVHVVDFSKKFYEILSLQPMAFKGEETFYEQDWRTMELGKKFDLILGDWVPGVLKTSDYDVFYRNIISHLKPDGLFIGRECLRPTREPVNLDEVVNKHYEQYADKYNFYQSSMQYVYGYLPDPKTAMWNIPASQAALDDVYKKGILQHDDYEFMTKALAVEKAPASVMVKDDFEKQVQNYFKILDIHYGAEPSHTWYPIYVFGLK